MNFKNMSDDAKAGLVAMILFTILIFAVTIGMTTYWVHYSYCESENLKTEKIDSVVKLKKLELLEKGYSEEVIQMVLED